MISGKELDARIWSFTKGLDMPLNAERTARFRSAILPLYEAFEAKDSYDAEAVASAEESFVYRHQFIATVRPYSNSPNTAVRAWNILEGSAGVLINGGGRAVLLPSTPDKPLLDYVRLRPGEKRRTAISTQGLFYGLVSEKLRETTGDTTDVYGCVAAFVGTHVLEHMPEEMPKISRAIERNIQIVPNLANSQHLAGMKSATML